MTPAEAALEYVLLSLSDDPAPAINFALAYEDSASSEDYAEYLNILDTKLSALPAETHDEYGGTTGVPLPGYAR